MTDPWQAQREALGAFIRTQRKMANLSLRQLAELTSLSNPYLSQVERGLHQPSVRVLKAISDALNLSAETLLAQAGLIDAVTGEGPDADEAGRADAGERAQGTDRGRDRGRRAPERRPESSAARGVPQHGRSVLTAAPPGTADVPGRHRAARVSCYAANAGGRRAA